MSACAINSLAQADITFTRRRERCHRCPHRSDLGRRSSRPRQIRYRQPHARKPGSSPCHAFQCLSKVRTAEAIRCGLHRALRKMPKTSNGLRSAPPAPARQAASLSGLPGQRPCPPRSVETESCQDRRPSRDESQRACADGAFGSVARWSSRTRPTRLSGSRRGPGHHWTPQSARCARPRRDACTAITGGRWPTFQPTQNVWWSACGCSVRCTPRTAAATPSANRCPRFTATAHGGPASPA